VPGDNSLSTHYKKEVIMPVKVLIRRKVKDGNLNQISKLLINARSGAMQQKGYISSETLSNCSDKNSIMVVSLWQNLENWESWKTSDTRKENEAKIEAITEGPAQYEAYNLGIQT
jgi:heme-degrading monooxygenase HmoA